MAARTIACSVVSLVCSLSTSQPPEPPAPARDRITIDSFDGGTVEEYVALLRRSFDSEPLNVIVAKNALRLRLPDLRLVDIDAKSAVGAIQVAESRGVHAVVRVLPPIGRAPDSAAPVYIVTTDGETPEDAAMASPTITRPFSLRSLLAAMVASGVASDASGASDVVLRAIEAADRQFEWFHPDAETPADAITFLAQPGILIASGSEGRLENIERVIAALTEGFADQPAPGAPGASSNVPLLPGVDRSRQDQREAILLRMRERQSRQRKSE